MEMISKLSRAPVAVPRGRPESPSRLTSKNRLPSRICEQLEDYGRVAVGGGVADQAEAEFAGKEVVPAPLHRAALGRAGAVEVHGLGQQERRRRLAQPEGPAGWLARVQQRGADLDLAEGNRDSLVKEQVEHHLAR